VPQVFVPIALSFSPSWAKYWDGHRFFSL
jgi:hypothetical protein